MKTEELPTRRFKIIFASKNNIFNYCDALLLFLLFVFCTGIHVISLLQTKFANGWDSYFYLIQIKTYITDGQMLSGRISLFYPFLLAMKYISGNYILAWKLTTAVLSALFSMTIYIFAKEMQLSRKLSFAISLFSACSAHLFYYSSQYLPNLMGMIFLVLFIIFLYKKALYIAALLMIINICTHKFTGALCISMFLLQISIPLFKRKTVNKYLLLALIPLLFIPFFPKIISWSDINRQFDLFSTIPQCTAISFFSNFTANIAIIWKIEIISFFLIFAYSTYLFIRQKDKNITIGILLSLILFLNFPFFRWDMLGFTYRFFLSSILLLPIILIYCLSLKQYTYSSYILYALSAIQLPFALWAYKPTQHDPPYGKYQFICHQIIHTQGFANAKLIIGHKGLAEFIKFTTNKDVMPWIPEYHINSDSLYRIVTDVEGYTLQTANLPTEQLCANYFLVKESDWQHFYAQQKKQNPSFAQSLNSWKNPMNIRPPFLQKYRTQ